MDEDALEARLRALKLNYEQWSTRSAGPGEELLIEEILELAVNAGKCEFAIGASIQFLAALEDPANQPVGVKKLVTFKGVFDGKSMDQLVWLAKAATSCKRSAEELLKWYQNPQGSNPQELIRLALQFRGQMQPLCEFVSGRSKLVAERARQLTKRGRENAKLTDDDWHLVLHALIEMVSAGETKYGAAEKISSLLAKGEFPGIDGVIPLSPGQIARKCRPS